AVWTSLTYQTGTLRKREVLGRVLAGLVAVVLLAALFETQPFVLSGMFAALGKPVSTGTGPLSDILAPLGKVLPLLMAVLAPAAAALVVFAQKLANLAKASMGEATWRAVLKRYASRLLLYLAAIIVPLLLWVTYIYLCFWAIRSSFDDGCGL